VLLLIPAAPPPAAAVRRVAGGGIVVWGRAAAPGAALSAEVRHTEAMLQAALTNGRAGCFGPDELLLDRLVAGHSRVAEVLQRRVADPLQRHDRGGLLIGTLRTYLSTGSVPITAKDQVVHPNTVSYRLRRVAELTGLDPRVPADAALLVLALGVVEFTNLGREDLPIGER
jgi:sugar diacid utilization regulator